MREPPVNVARDAFACMHAALFDRLAEPCNVQRGTDAPVTVRAIIDDGVARVGQYGNVIGRQTKVTFLRDEWQPQRGDFVIIDDTARKVETIDTDDGFIVEAVLHG